MYAPLLWLCKPQHTLNKYSEYLRRTWEDAPSNNNVTTGSRPPEVFIIVCLIHWGWVTYTCISKVTNNNATSHYLKQWWNINSNLGNKLQWNLKQNLYIFIQENAFENVILEMTAILYQPQCVNVVAASWSSGRVQDSGLGSRSSPGFNTLPVRLLVVPLSKALHAALLLSTQEQMGTCEGRFVSRGAKLRVSGCILPRELRWLSRRIWTVKGPMTREGTCQSLQSRALSLDVDSKQWLYLYL